MSIYIALQLKKKVETTGLFKGDGGESGLIVFFLFKISYWSIGLSIGLFIYGPIVSKISDPF